MIILVNNKINPWASLLTDVKYHGMRYSVHAAKEFCAGTWQTFLYKAMSALPLRERYILTREGHLRARYKTIPVLALLATVTITAAQIISFTNSTRITAIAEATQSALPAVLTAAVQYDIDPALVKETSQKRLQRYAGQTNTTPEQTPDKTREKTLTVAKGGTMAAILQQAGLDANGAQHALDEIRKFYNPRALRAGQKLQIVSTSSSNGTNDFKQLTMDMDLLQTLRLQRTGDGSFTAQIDKKETRRRQYARQTPIELSLYGSALEAGVPPSVIAETIRIFSWDVDFQRDIRQGDVLDVMYDQVETEDGTPVENGNIVFARLSVNGHEIPLYRFETTNGNVDYYTPDGTSIRKALLTTPVDGARLSSGFGMRKHPILGYSKMHKGMDFAAPTGTPIYAAGDGVIEHLGRWSAYGNYIRIRHNSTMKTAYAHMSKFAKGLEAGSRVKQGQLIGYIGTTGRSTGPHLHYEVMVNGAQVNPRSVKMQPGETLKGKQLTAFRSHVEKVNKQYAALIGEVRMASATQKPPTLR